MVDIRKATLEDVEYFKANIRQADREEVMAFSGETIEQVLDDTPDLDKNADVWFVDNEPVAIFGVTPWEDRGIPWMLATEEFAKHRVEFARECKEYVYNNMLTGYNYYMNYVHADHTDAVRWLKWLGFTIHAAEPLGINGELFHKFDMEVKDV